MKNIKALISLLLLPFMISACGKEVTEPSNQSSLTTDSTGTEMETEIFDVISDSEDSIDGNIDPRLEHYKLNNISDYTAIGSTSINLRVNQNKHQRNNVASMVDEKESSELIAYSSTDLFHAISKLPLESEYPFFLVGQTENGIEPLSFSIDNGEHGVSAEEKEIMIQIEAIMEIGDYIAFYSADESYNFFASESGYYYLNQGVSLFSGGLTFLLSKKTGKIYDVSKFSDDTTLALAVDSSFASGHNIIFKPDKNTVFFCYEEDEKLVVKSFPVSFDIYDVDKYGTMYTSIGFVSSDLKVYPYSSYFDGKKYNLDYIKCFDWLCASFDGRFYYLDKNCSFTEMPIDLRIKPLLSISNGKITCLNYSYLDAQRKKNENLIDISSVLNITNYSGSVDLQYETPTEKCFPIQYSKPSTWSCFAVRWIDCFNRYKSYLGDEYCKEYRYLYEKLLKSKYNEASMDEVELMIKTIIKIGYYKSGMDYLTDPFYNGFFDTAGIFTVPANECFLYGSNLSGYSIVYSYENIISSLQCEFYVDGNTYSSYGGSEYVMRLLGFFNYVNGFIFRGNYIYHFLGSNKIVKFNMIDTTITTIVIDGYNVTNMFVEDGNIVVEGIDSDFNKFLGYIDINDDLKFEPTDFGLDTIDVLYPIN